MPEQAFFVPCTSPVFYDASTLDENQEIRFALQADATPLGTGRHPWQMTVTEHLLDGNGNPLTRLQTFEGVHDVHSRAESVFGNRWDLLLPRHRTSSVGGGNNVDARQPIWCGSPGWLE